MLCQPPTDLAAISTAIQESRELVESKVDSVCIDHSLMNRDTCKVDETVTEAEALIYTTEDHVATLKRQVSKLLSMGAALEERVEDVENPSRRKNLCLSSSLEWEEVSGMDSLLDEWSFSSSCRDQDVVALGVTLDLNKNEKNSPSRVWRLGQPYALAFPSRCEFDD
ncbi:hypothetical protein NDU88_000776 [Pleurodeles waltl]|uniref:Uncharacterized protein n=1 Tax=Pleurodeles waltl TaxID=8319 RepID=A0AAV7VX79_PLEWA|nr:hypothetical protein NDU88_000776 [Pleurodeles waltl]